MLGAQALRTKQKVEQKEREKRQREKKKSMEIQRDSIQRLADEDAKNAVLAYLSEQGGVLPRDINGAPIGFIRKQQRGNSCVVYDPITAADFGNLGNLSTQYGTVSSGQRSQQRHSLNVNMSFVPTHRSPASAKASFSGSSSTQKRSSADANKCKVSTDEDRHGNRFLRFFGFPCSNNKCSKESRRMSTA